MQKRILVPLVLLVLLVTTGCGARRRALRATATTEAAVPTATAMVAASPAPRMPTPTSAAAAAPSPTRQASPTARPAAPTPTPVAAAAADTPTTPARVGRQVITSNDFVPEQLNSIDTIVVSVNYSDRRDTPFDLAPHWDKIFGAEDPTRQLNGYYRENFYGQLELRPVQLPEFGAKGYVEIELDGSPGDYPIGWLIGLESDDIAGIDPDVVQRFILDIMAQVVGKHPQIDFQDKFMFVVLNAVGNEYGRGAMGALPTGSLYDLFVGDVTEADVGRFADDTYFRVVNGTRVVGVIKNEGYTFDDYFRDRESHFDDDQFIRGMAIFGQDAPLSCASHDILHGLRRASAFADPPEGRGRAADCLYNLPLQSQWIVGTGSERFDRSVNTSPYIGWWDPMADHLHPVMPRAFFSGQPHGMCAFTKLRMGLIPERCVATADADDVTIKLAPLSSPTLPARGAEAESLAIKVPLVPGNETLAHIYLLLEYRRRVGSETGESHPDNFTISPDDVFGDKTRDPGYNPANPAESRYVNPPTTFVSKEGVLVYLVNEKMPDIPALLYTEWYNFVLALLNPEGNEKRDDLTQAALDAGESIVVDFRNIYPDRGVPIVITVSVADRTPDYAQVHITREHLR